ncbi:hypothetical protein EDD18DRAFT_1116438 [Armillaria luteobubalina]|uniref:Uncharacterized protein n=1 Tax=Armillaria luteobubalina TaxID=153913 RepID=A0AA39P0A7_9AGAR|nr:hypothetical protein EDD18DRAFT_1116438 [Armillaria luteobubalina]
MCKTGPINPHSCPRWYLKVIVIKAYYVIIMPIPNFRPAHTAVTRSCLLDCTYTIFLYGQYVNRSTMVKTDQSWSPVSHGLSSCQTSEPLRKDWEIEVMNMHFAYLAQHFAEADYHLYGICEPNGLHSIEQGGFVFRPDELNLDLLMAPLLQRLYAYITKTSSWTLSVQIFDNNQQINWNLLHFQTLCQQHGKAVKQGIVVVNRRPLGLFQSRIKNSGIWCATADRLTRMDVPGSISNLSLCKPFLLLSSHPSTSTFLDLEAGVSRDDKVDSLYEDSDEDFIAEEDSADSMTESTAFDRATASTVDDKSQAWMSFLERARSCANDLKSSLETEVRSDIGLFDMPASELLVLQCFCGWEESVVLHIGWCAWPELGIKAAFITPLMKEMVWIEADLSPNLKKWLFDIPGVVRRNQQVLLHTISPDDSWRALASSLDIANEIPQKLANLFVQSAHPLVGEAITDISRHISRTINGVGEHGLEVKFADGLFPVRWADCRKEFEIGTYVEITGEEHATRWSGWIHGIDDGLLHLISRSGPENEQIEICGVHPNCVSTIAPPHIASIQQDNHSQCQGNTMSIVPWKGVMVQVIKPGHHWRGKTGYMVDVNITMDQQRNKEILQILVQLSHYDPNAPFVSLWFGYHDIIDEESWLPLNEAHPLVKDTDFFRHVILVTNVLGKRGRRLPPEPVAPPRSVTPQPDPTEQCLSPTWNPSAPDPPPIQYWCLNHRLLNSRFRVQYNNLKITALVHYDLTLHEIVCIRDDTPLRLILDPSRVLAIHPKVRHYDLFLVILVEDMDPDGSTDPSAKP